MRRSLALVSTIALVVSVVLGGIRATPVVAASGTGGPGDTLYIALGDSLAWGDGASVPDRTGYVPRLAGYFQGASHGGADRLVNLAVGGTTTGQLINGRLGAPPQLSVALGLIADPGTDTRVVTISVGGNDLLNLINDPDDPCILAPTSPECQGMVAAAMAGVAQNMPVILGSLKVALAADPGEEKVFVLLPYNAFSGSGHPLEPLIAAGMRGADMTIDCAANMVNPLNVGLDDILACTTLALGDVVVDAYPLFEGRTLQLTHIADGYNVHPNDAGYEVIAKAHRVADRAAWSIVDLGSPLGGWARAVKVNDAGQVLIMSQPPSRMSQRAFVWHDGVTTDLGTLGGTSTVAWDINEKGQAVGSSLTSSMEGHAFIWQDGVMNDLGTLGGHSADALDINDRGEVVGVFGTPSGLSHAFIWRQGVMTDLGTLGGDYARAEAVNERGQVVGQSTTASGEMHAFLWEDGAMVDLGAIGAQGRVEAITDDGQIVGNRSATGEHVQAFIWRDGVMTDIGTAGWTDTGARSVNDGAQVVGVSQVSPAIWHAFVSLDGVATDLGTLGGYGFSGAYDINDSGQIVGDSSTLSGFSHAFVVDDGVMTDLPSLGGHSMAVDIGERGLIVGGSTSPDGDEHAVLWTRP